MISPWRHGKPLSCVFTWLFATLQYTNGDCWLILSFLLSGPILVFLSRRTFKADQTKWMVPFQLIPKLFRPMCVYQPFNTSLFDPYLFKAENWAAFSEGISGFEQDSNQTHLTHHHIYFPYFNVYFRLLSRMDSPSKVDGCDVLSCANDGTCVLSDSTNKPTCL